MTAGALCSVMSLIKIKIINMETSIFNMVKMMRMKIQRRNLKTIIVKKKGISTSQGDELGRGVRVPGVP